MSVETHPKECCYGCAACAYVCPADSICMVEDEEGFLYPHVNTKLCTQCNACEGICPFCTTQPQARYPRSVYAVKHQQKTVREGSTSGGAYTLISDVFLKRKGVVYGVGLDEDMIPRFACARNFQERNRFRGTKYVQANLDRPLYAQIEADLGSGRLVAFFGTPCQADAVRRLFEPYTEQLTVIDLVCYGVPSPLLWREHLRSLQARFGNKVVGYSFRDKRFGWHSHVESAMFSDGKLRWASAWLQAYRRIFHGRYAHRPCCYHCPYTRSERSSDLTIGDFWGIEKTYPSFDDSYGVSLLLVNTEKGEQTFEQFRSQGYFLETSLQDALQPRLREPTNAPTDRAQFWQNLSTHGYTYVSRKYGRCDLKGRLIQRVWFAKHKPIRMKGDV